MILAPPESVRKLQTALQAKAKGAPNYRFYLLYDKLYREDVLTYAYQRCKANKGAPGIDGQEFVDIEAYGEERWLGERRTHSAGRRIEPRRFDGCGFRKRAATSCVRWGFLELQTAWS
jgi:RNA-directed DNA polymerase